MPGLREEARQALPKEHRVVRDDHAQGNSAWIRVPPGVAAVHEEATTECLGAVGNATQAATGGVGAAPAVVRGR